MNPAAAQEIATGSQGAHAAAGQFNAGEVIIGHVSNSSHEHPLIHLPTIGGIDFSVTKHVFMLWVVAALVFVTITTLVRRYVRQTRLVLPHLHGELQGEARLLDVHRDLADVLGLARGDRLGGLRGLDLRGVELVERVREEVAEAARGLAAPADRGRGCGRGCAADAGDGDDGHRVT